MDSEDPIEKAIGRFGRYQTLIFLLITLGRLPAEFQLTNVVFLIPSPEYTCLDDTFTNLTNVCPCENVQFDQSIMTSSITSTWNLACDRSSLRSLTQSMLQLGILAGSLIYGQISDRYGRKLAVTLALLLEAATTTLSAFATELWMFIALRCLIGVSVGGTMMCCYVFLIELSGKSFLPYFISIHELCYVSGYFFLPVIAYFVRDWRNLLLATSVPWLLTVTFFWILTESPRWLITVGRKHEAIGVLTYIARKNNMPTDKIEDLVNELEKETIKESAERRGTFLDLFKTPQIRIYTAVMAMIWLCTSHIFYGINQYIGRLQGNIYLNVILSALALLPGLVLVSITARFLKRRTAIIISFVVSGTSLIILMFIPGDMGNLTLVFAITGHIGAYNAFTQIYLYSSEVFPTLIRNSAIGFASVFARIGGFIAPFIVDIGVEWISILVFSALAYTAAVLCCFLPETKGKVLPNTIDETEMKSKPQIALK